MTTGVDSGTSAPNTLRKLRRSKGLTINAVAKRVGVSDPTVWRWENEVSGRVPNVAQASTLAEIYGVTVEEIAAMFSGGDNTASA